MILEVDYNNLHSALGSNRGNTKTPISSESSVTLDAVQSRNRSAKYIHTFTQIIGAFVIHFFWIIQY